MFYTPSDVAEHMVGEANARSSTAVSKARFLDPACGTGVFLLAQMRYARARGIQNLVRYAAENLFAFDLNPVALDSCAFVLVHECMITEGLSGVPPWAVWHAIRLNLVEADALCVLPVDGRDRAEVSALRASRKAKKEALLSGCITTECAELAGPVAPTPQPAVDLFGTPVENRCPLALLFPEAVDGFQLIVGNPPYTRVGARADLSILKAEYDAFRAFSPTGAEEVYPLFLEAVWRLGQPGRVEASFVVPLSIAFGGSKELVGFRRAIVDHPGAWRFAFFDREPHALFGEDVKTRNAIVWFSSENLTSARRPAPPSIFTTRLHKWTSRHRSQLFSSLVFTDLDSFDITDGIPKLAGESFANAYRQIRAQRNMRARDWVELSTCTPEQAANSTVNRYAYVGSTAYNFLNVSRARNRPSVPDVRLSENKLHQLEFRSELAADIAFAILSSNLVFWLWHVEGDGFHVTRRFIESLPIQTDGLSELDRERVGGLGSQLWEGVLRGHFLSYNKGRATATFRPFGFEDIRRQIDAVLIHALQLSEDFIDDLQVFVHQTVVIDAGDRSRARLIAPNQQGQFE